MTQINTDFYETHPIPSLCPTVEIGANNLCNSINHRVLQRKAPLFTTFVAERGSGGEAQKGMGLIAQPVRL